MPRPTRAERHSQTRAQLLTTARQLFFEDGYHPTSLEKVAEAAGYSKGAVYSNFRNKDELCSAVLDEVHAERLGEALALVAQTDTSERADSFRDWAQRVIGDPGWTSLEVEYAVHARRDDAQRTELAGRLDTLLTTIAATADGITDSEEGLPSREAATIVLALGVGLGLFRAIDPTIPVDGIVDVLTLLTRGPLPQPHGQPGR